MPKPCGGTLMSIDMDRLLDCAAREDVLRRVPRARALEVFALVARTLDPFVERLSMAGSLRRGKDTIKDVDVVAIPKDGCGDAALDAVQSLERTRTDHWRGPQRLHVIVRGVPVDVLLTTTVSWGAALQYLTGSRDHNIGLRTLAKSKGLTLNEYGVFSVKDGKKIAGEDEGGVYRVLGVRWLPPPYREGFLHFRGRTRPHKRSDPTPPGDADPGSRDNDREKPPEAQGAVRAKAGVRPTHKAEERPHPARPPSRGDDPAGGRARQRDRVAIPPTTGVAPRASDRPPPDRDRVRGDAGGR